MPTKGKNREIVKEGDDLPEAQARLAPIKRTANRKQLL